MRFVAAVLAYLLAVQPATGQVSPDIHDAGDSFGQWVADSLVSAVVEMSDSAYAALRDSTFSPQEGRANIVRDEFGVPHVYGKTDRDVAFGFGYAQAQDHLIQMLLSFRMARGEAAEVLGPTLVDSDFKARHWRVDRVAGERYGAIGEDTRNYVNAFVEGINHYIEVHRPWLPAWVEPARPTDVIAASRWLGILLSEQRGRKELAEIGLSQGEPGKAGSNQIVVTPARSATGRALALMDPHLPWKIPFATYEAHLVSGEGLDVYGATFFGWPVIVFGHNASIAWSFTVNDIDIFDVYELKLDPANNRRYLFEREKQRISSQRTTVRVLQDGFVQDVSRDLLYSHHGPIVKMMDEWAYAAKSTAEEVVDGVGQLYAMNKAANLQQFRLAMARLEIPMFNVMYTDTSGTAFYAFQGRVPIRSAKFDWTSPVPGWTQETAWSGFIPFSQLPQVIDPAAGFLQNCNTPPDAVTVDSGLDRDTFPGHMGWGEMTNRGRRAMNWLRAHPFVRPGDLLTLARDEYLIEAEQMKGMILSAYNRAWASIYDPDARVAKSIDLLRSWDNRATADSRATLLFGTWFARFGPLVQRLPVEQRDRMDVLENIALEALLSTVASLTERYGRVDVRWGDVHVIERGDAEHPTGGPPPGAEAMHQTWSRLTEDGRFSVYGGSSFTCVVEMTSPPTAWTLLPFGSSEDSQSLHYADQAARQADGLFKQAVYKPLDVWEAHGEIVSVPLSESDAQASAVALSRRLTLQMGGDPDSSMTDSTTSVPENSSD